jgi:esterase/lipase superfamily enzyme
MIRECAENLLTLGGEDYWGVYINSARIGFAGSRVYPVWYATNRGFADPSDPSVGFNGKRDVAEKVHFGRCAVAIPAKRTYGSVGSPLWTRFVTRTDDRLRIVDRTALEPNGFWGALQRRTLGEPDEQEALIYLHGYNCSFDHAAIRAAQIGLDLKFPGLMAFFSWPSLGSARGYAADAAAIESSEPALTDFLIGFANESGARRIHLVGHSMGTRGLLRAIQRISASASQAASIRFGQIFLAAPDLDAGLFRDLAPHCPLISERTTLYVSQRDRALGFSRWLHRYDRVGYAPPVTVVPEIDTVDVTGVDKTIFGHTYFAQSRAVLYDIDQILRHNAEPRSRLGLQLKRNDQRLIYYGADR